VLVLDALVVIIATLFYHKFLAVCFDEEYARLRGVRTDLYYLLLLCLTALTVVLLVRLTLPAAVASNFAKGLWQMMVLATLFCIGFIGSGLAVSYNYDLPSGPTIIVIAGLVYLGATGWRQFRKNSRLRSAV